MSNFDRMIIKDVCDFIGGSQPPKSEFSEVLKEGYVRLVQTRDFKTDNFVTYINRNSTTKFFQLNDIMIGRYGPPVFQIFRGMEGAYNVALLKAKPKENILNDYLYYFLKQEEIFEYVDKLSARTGGQTGVDLVSLYNYPITLPKLDAQQKIAKVLVDLDIKIELNNKINTELEAMAKTLYDYWFVQFDFTDANGKPYKSSGGKMVYNVELKREIPEGWEVKYLGQLLNTDLGGTPSTKIDKFWGGAIPWLNSGEIANFPIVESEDHITNEAILNSATTLMPAGTCVLSITRHLRPSILAIDACANQSVVGIFESEKFKSSYIYPYLKNEIPRLMTLRSGAQQPHINKGTVDESLMIDPSKIILEKYYKKANSVYKQIINNSFQNQQLASLRDWLLPMLMNGQVSVGDVEVELGMVAAGRAEYKKH
jgi:type I restriction enzyme S subunit